MTVGRHGLRRSLLAAALALATGQAVAAPAAHAESSATCPQDGSTRLLSSAVLSRDYRLWVWQPDASTVHVCFVTGPTGHTTPRDLFTGDFAAGDLVVRSTGSDPVVPTVTPVVGDDSCAEVAAPGSEVGVLDRPAVVVPPLSVTADATGSAWSVCVGPDDGPAVRVTVGSVGVVDATLWLDGDAWVTCHVFQACAGDDHPVRLSH